MSHVQCAACLDSRKCWVCSGRGQLETAPNSVHPCAACEGTGQCSVCTLHGAETPADALAR